MILMFTPAMAAILVMLAILLRNSFSGRTNL